jgi:hypothetical protein
MVAVFSGKTLESPQLAGRNDAGPSKSPSNLIYRILETDASWALLLVLLNVAFFSDALFTDKTFFVRDVSFFHYPLKRLVTEAYSQGHWPLWNPYVQLGQPLLANPNAMALYPSQLLFQLLPFELAFDLHFVLHCLLAGIATFYLARALGISRYASFLSAVVYNFSGVTLSFLNLFNILPVVAFLPLLSLALLKALRQFSLFKTACTSFLFGIFFLLLEPLSSLAVCLFLVPFLAWIFVFLPQPRMPFTRGALLVVAMVASGVSLAAVQILPTLELINHSGRSEGMDFGVVSFWSLHPVSLMQVIFPRFFGEYFRLSEPPPWGNLFFDNREPYLLSCYFGLFPLLLGLFGGLFSKRRWLGSLLLGLSFVALLLALGKYCPAYSWLFQNIPVFRYGRYPVKFLVVTSFCFSLLVGLGLDRLEELRVQLLPSPKRTRWGVFLFASLVFLLLCFSISLSSERILNWFTKGAIGPDHISLHYQGQPINIGRPLITEALEKIQIHLGGFLLLLGLIFWSKVRFSILRGALLSLVLLDLLISNFWINPLIRSELYEPAPAALFLVGKTSRQGLARTYSFEQNIDKGQVILGQTDSVAWVAFYRKLTLFQFLAAKDHVQYSVFNPIDRLETSSSQKIREELGRLQTLDDKLEFLRELNVGFILSSKEIGSRLLALEGMFQVNGAQPFRVYRLVGNLSRVFLADDLSTGRWVSDQDPESLHAPGERDVPGPPSSFTPSKGDEARITNYLPNRVEVQASADKNCLLVLLDGYYPGWKATVDGAATEVLRFRQAFRAIELPAGRHSVVFSFSPNSFWYGFYLSLFVALAWAISLFWCRMVSGGGSRSNADGQRQ